MKKHLTQMSNVEKKFVWERIKSRRAMVNHRNIQVNGHAKERMSNRPRFNVDLPIIIDTIKNSRFYEYKIIREGDTIVDERVLLRSDKVYNGSNLVLVYSIKKNRVITLWANKSDDNHSTLDLSSYNEDMKIVGVVK